MSLSELLLRRRQLQQEQERDYLKLMNIAAQSSDNARRDVDHLEQCQKVIAQMPRPRADSRRQLEQD